jgi:UDP-3-O-[3-hydroxymyristoyl] glucosamine N-acyltransferase
MKLSEIAKKLGARLDHPSGGDPEITGIAGIEEAVGGQLTFVHNPKYAPAAKTTQASAIIVALDFPAIEKPTLRTDNPHLAFARALELFFQPPRYAPGVHPTAVIHETARIGANAHIGPYVVLSEDVEIGDNAVLLAHVVVYSGVRVGKNFFAHAHAVVRERCRLGDNVILQNGAIVGCDGFGFAKDGANWHKIVQSGPAILEDSVEIQANACIDRATVGQTRIGAGAKIDNLVQVGHACEIGSRTLLCGQAGLAGSSVVGNDVILAGQVGVAGHCTIGDGAIVTAQSGVPSDVEPGKLVSGFPAIENKHWLRCVAVFNRLPELARELRALSAAVKIRAEEEPKK